MKVATRSIKTESSGNLGRASRFTIAGSAKAFDSLSSGLYKDSIRAIVRELGTNAADAHIEANKRTIPFVVHLPTQWEPWFMVKDLGVGLDDPQIRGFTQCVVCDHIENADFDETQPCPSCGKPKMAFQQGIYTTYFASTKTHSDDYTGCLGLGSKSPFSYTDSFSVISIKNGIKRIYTCYKDEGMPGVNLMHSEETTEPNGVEVKFPVDAKDFGEFRTKTIETYRWFTPRPMVTGVVDSNYETTQTVLETGDWAIMKDEQSSWSVLMGNVNYEIEYGKLDASFKATLTPHEKYVAEKVGPLMRVDIGEVDMAVSRESLKYTEKTFTSLKRRLAQIVRDCLAEAERRLEKCETLWSARIELRKLSRSHWLSGLLSDTGVMWRGKKIQTSIMVGDANPRVGCRTYRITRSRNSGRPILRREDTNYIIPDDDMEIFINDANTFNKRIQRHLESFGCPDKRDRSNHTVYLLYDLPGRSVASFVEQEDLGPVVRKVSELYEPERAKTYRPKTAKLLHFSYKVDYPTYAWEDAEVNLDDPHVYLEVSGYNWHAGSFGHSLKNESKRFHTPAEFKLHWNSIVKFVAPDLSNEDTLLMNKIIGVRSAMLDKVVKRTNWVRFDVWLKAKCEAAVQERLDAAKMHLWEGVGNKVTRIISHTAKTDTLKPTSPFRVLHDIYADLEAVNTSVAQHCSTACRSVGVELPSLKKITDKIAKFEPLFKARYPMFYFLEHIGHIRDEPEGAKILSYAAMMDKRPAQPAQLTEGASVE